MKRYLFVAALAVWLPLTGSVGLAAESATLPEACFQVAQARGGQACMDKCERAKNDCMAYYVQSDSRSGRYVTADGAKVCWESYHQCKRDCPR